MKWRYISNLPLKLDGGESLSARFGRLNPREGPRYTLLGCVGLGATV